MSDQIIQQLGFDAQQAIAELGRLDTAFTNLERRMGSVTEAMKLFNSVGGNVASALKQIGGASAHIDQAAKHTEQLTVSFQMLGRIVATQAIVRTLSTIRDSFKDAATSAIEFQTRLGEISTIAPSGMGGMGQYGERIRELSDKWNIPLQDVTKGLYETISNQVKGDPFQFMESAAAFSKGSVTNFADSVRLLSGLLNAYNLDATRTDEVSAKLFRTIDLGAVTGTDLANSMGRVYARAQQLGISIDELGAAFATLTIRGLRHNEAATQIGGTLSALVKPTDAMQAKFKELGFSSSETATQTLGYAGVLKALADSTRGSAEEMAKLFPNVRGLAGALSIGDQAFSTFQASLQGIAGTTAAVNQQMGLKVLATDGQQVGKAFTQLSNILTADIGQSIIRTGAGFLRLTGGVESLKTGLPALSPLLLTGTGLLGTYTVAAYTGATANKTFAATFPGVAQGLLLVAGAMTAGKMLGNSLMDAYRDPVRQFDEASKQAVAKLRAAEEENNRAIEAAEDKRVRIVLEAGKRLNAAYLQDVANADRASGPHREDCGGVAAGKPRQPSHRDEHYQRREHEPGRGDCIRVLFGCRQQRGHDGEHASGGPSSATGGASNGRSDDLE